MSNEKRFQVRESKRQPGLKFIYDNLNGYFFAGPMAEEKAFKLVDRLNNDKDPDMWFLPMTHYNGELI